jgi:hypothetical protein
VVSELITWLRAQLDEDERVALAVGELRRQWTTAGGYPETGVTQVVADDGYLIVEVDTDWAAEIVTHIARHDPARVLAQVEAKRRLLDLHDGWHSCGIWECDGDCPTVRLLALPYAGRDGYDETWRPE